MKKLLISRWQVLVPFLGFSLACAWTGVLFFQNNVGQLFLQNFSVQFAIVTVLCIALWLIGTFVAVFPLLFRVRWSISRAFSVLTVGLFFFFSYEAIRNWLEHEFSFKTSVIHLTYIVIVIGALFAAWVTSRHEPIRVAISISAMFLVLLSSWKVLPNVIARFDSLLISQDFVPVAGEASGALSKKNVYYVILDSYGGAPALRKYLGYDNAPFLEKMEKLGYTDITLSRANYTVTHISLSATLNMNYILNVNSQKYSDRGEFFPGTLRKKQLPELVRKFYLEQYNFIHIGNVFAPCYSRSEVMCMNNAIGQPIYMDVLARFLAPSRILRILMPFDISELDALTPLLSAIEGISAQKKPSFFFVHHMLPHEPFNSDCSRSILGVSKQNYINAVKCVNHSVVLVAEKIRKFDPDAIVVFQADHGSGFQANWQGSLAGWSAAAIDERSSVLNLVHLPAACRKWVRPDLSPINTMRLVLGCLQGTRPDYLAERTYLTTYETFPDYGSVVEVTNLLPERYKGAGLVEGR